MNMEHGTNYFQVSMTHNALQSILEKPHFAGNMLNDDITDQPFN